jgi:hypothetical protein
MEEDEDEAEEDEDEDDKDDGDDNGEGKAPLKDPYDPVTELRDRTTRSDLDLVASEGEGWVEEYAE